MVGLSDPYQHNYRELIGKVVRVWNAVAPGQPQSTCHCTIEGVSETGNGAEKEALHVVVRGGFLLGSAFSVIEVTEIYDDAFGGMVSLHDDKRLLTLVILKFK